MPGLLGGVVAAFVVPGIAKAQIAGIIVTMALAIAGGVAGGFIIRATGSRETVYEDGEEFSNAQG
jgi:ammonium transporter Rh